MKNKIISIGLSIISLLSVIFFAGLKTVDAKSEDYELFYSQLFEETKNDFYQTIEIDKNESEESVLKKLKKYEFSKQNNGIETVDEYSSEIKDNSCEYQNLGLISRDKEQFFVDNDFAIKDFGEYFEVYPKFQFKRLIVQGKLKNNYGASKVISGYKDYYVLCYETESQTKYAYSMLVESEKLSVSIDSMVYSDGYADKNYDYSEYNSWGAEAIDIAGYLDYLKSNKMTEKEIVVAVIDTGINTSHEMFENRLLKDDYGYYVGYSFYSSAYTYSGYEYEDDNGHGTHVSGIIADLTPENVKILPIKSLSSNGKGSMTNVLAGVSYVCDLTEKYNISCVNMSLGVEDSDSESKKLYENLFADLRNKGILTTVAAGNDSKNVRDCLPASIDNAIVVSAIKKGQDFAYEFDSEYSNYGSTVDISAPGTSINSAYIGTTSSVNSDVYKKLDGTSMATPFVSSAISLIYLENTANLYKLNYSFSEKIEKQLKENTLDLGEKGFDEYYGYGMLNFKYFNLKTSNAKIEFKNSVTGEEIIQKDGFTEFNSNFNLVATCSDANFKIYYTTDGSMPTKNSLCYTSAIEINTTKSFSFIAYKFDNDGNIIDVSDVYFIGLFNANMNIWNYVKIMQFASGNVYVIGYTGHFTNLTIPSHFQDIEIVGIRASVFENNKELETVTLSDSIREIGKSAFSRCQNLKTVYAPMVETIGENVFYGCDKLEEIYAPKTTQVGSYSFYGTNFTYLYSNEDDENVLNDKKGGYFKNLTDIGIYGFADCCNLIYVNLENVEILQECAFADCDNLEVCNVKNAKTINSFVFDYCYNLKEFYIGKNVSMIGSTVFRGTALTKFEIDSENDNFYTDGNGLYGINRLISFVSDKNIGMDYEILTYVRIKGIDTNITSIDDYTFENANIKRLTISEDIETIGKGCFYGASIDIIDYYSRNLQSTKYISNSTVYSIFEKTKIKQFNIYDSVQSTPSGLFRNANIDVMNINIYDISYNSNTFTKSSIKTIYLNFDNDIDLTFISEKTKTPILVGLENIYLKSKLDGNHNINYRDSQTGDIIKTFYYSDETKNGYYHYGIKENSKFSMFYDVSDFETSYDGKFHNITINVDGVSNYTVVYGLSEGKYDISNINSNEAFKNATNGKMTVYFKLSADGWEDTFGFGYLTINKIDLDLVISSSNGYYGETPNLDDITYKVIKGSFVSGESLNLSYYTSATEKSNVGNYLITPKFVSPANNYNINFTYGNYEVLKRKITLKFRDLTQTYGETMVTGDEYDIVSGSVVGDDDLKIEIDYGTTNFFAGTYQISLKKYDNANYEITQNYGTFSIEKRVVEIKLTSGSSTFGDDITIDENSYAVTSGSFVFDDASLIDFKAKTSASSTSDVGIYNVKGLYNENSNYTINVTDGKYVISKRRVKLYIEDSSSVFGENVILLGYRIHSGNFIGDDEKLCDIKVSTIASSSSDVGDYEIKCDFNKMKNYSVSVVYNGKHTIKKRDITIAIHNAESVYGENIYLSDYEIESGNFVGDDYSKLNFSVYCDITNLTDVGTYPINATYSDLTNYNIIVKDGYYTINKREIVIKIYNHYGIYGEDIKLGNYEISKGEFVGDDGSKLNLKLTTNALNNSGVGNYEISATYDNLKNYDIKLIGGSYIISKRKIEVQLSNQSGTYGDVPRYNSNYTIISGSKLENDDLMIIVSADIDKTSNVGKYILCGSSNNSNYDIVVQPAVYTIEKRKVTIKAEDQKLPHFGNMELDQTKYIVTNGLVVNDDDLNVCLFVDGLERKSNWGFYEIKVTANNDNYEIVAESGELELEISIYDGILAGGIVLFIVIFCLIISGAKAKKKRKKMNKQKISKKSSKQKNKVETNDEKKISSQSVPIEND